MMLCLGENRWTSPSGGHRTLGAKQCTYMTNCTRHCSRDPHQVGSIREAAQVHLERANLL